MPAFFEANRPWRGLWVSGGKDTGPLGSVRRGRGLHRVFNGTLRSRNGSTLATSVDAHSLFRYNGKRYAGAGTDFTEDGSIIKSMLDGSRLAFATMPPVAEKQDYLFCSGGGDLFKVSPTGVVTQWGIDAPGSALTAAEGAAGNLGAGTYQYKVTFGNSTSGHRSNGNATAASVTIAASKQVDLTDIPTSADAQVDQREIWRTVAGGAVFFLLTTINDNSTTTATDNTADADLSSTELPDDNDPPADTYEDCAGPFDARMWWTRNTVVGTEGRIYFSPVGRPEGVESFLEVSTTDDKMQKVILWNGLWGISRRKWFRIIGGDTPIFIETEGVVGTTVPETVTATPFGIVYEAEDGVRLFDGRQSTLLFPDAVLQLFQGDAAENLTAMTGVVAGYARNEYLISDESQTIAVNLRTGTWRDLGLGIRAFHFEEDTGKLQASANSTVLLLEEEGATDDNGTAISFAVEFPAVSAGPSQEGLQLMLFLDIDPNGQTLTPTLVFDGSTTDLGTVTGTGRQVIEIPHLLKGRLQGIRLTGSLTAQVTIYGVHSEVYAPTLPELAT